METDSKEDYFLKSARDRAIQFIHNHHDLYGHFAILEFYPTYDGKKHKGWFYTYSCPFLHANVMYALINADVFKHKDLLKRAASFLFTFREPGDLWRFWKNSEALHPVYCGVDDTAVSSLALRKLDYTLNNHEILYSRITKSGAVLTWIIADLKLFFINPISFCWLKYNDRLAIPTEKQWQLLAHDDAEPSISANVLAYLGESDRTKTLVNYLINSWENDNAGNYVYYEKKIIFAYHLARAYKEGNKSLEAIKKSAVEFVESNLTQFVFAELLMAYLCISYFEGAPALINDIKSRITQEIMLRDAFTDNYPYITEKKRIYYGGAGVLTAAWFLEVTKDW